MDTSVKLVTGRRSLHIGVIVCCYPGSRLDKKKCHKMESQLVTVVGSAKRKGREAQRLTVAKTVTSRDDVIRSQIRK